MKTNTFFIIIIENLNANDIYGITNKIIISESIVVELLPNVENVFN